jgi:hypothetical protein
MAKSEVAETVIGEVVAVRVACTLVVLTAA